MKSGNICLFIKFLFCFWQYIVSLHNPFTSHALLNTSNTWATCLIWLQAQLFDLCATKFPVLFGNEKCWAGESQQLIIFLLLEFMWCIWGQLPPVCASAFLSAQSELSQREEECMPGRLLPPHQTCPLPLLSLCLSFTMIHTQRESSSCPFFSVCSPSLLLTISPSNTHLLLDAHSHSMCSHASVWTRQILLLRTERALVRYYYAGYISRNWGAKGLCNRDVAILLCCNYHHVLPSKLFYSLLIHAGKSGSLQFSHSPCDSGICYKSLFLAINVSIILYSLVSCKYWCALWLGFREHAH